jgi:hypothetical protein
MGYIESNKNLRTLVNLTPISTHFFGQRVIQNYGKSLNSCIIKTPLSPVLADHTLKTRGFGPTPKPLEFDLPAGDGITTA